MKEDHLMGKAEPGPYRDIFQINKLPDLWLRYVMPLYYCTIPS